ncbi:GLPGLI family protein [Chryseobacterium sp. RP-3-3]|uniref:GLPGLI family protein n=1 Tax=Chryseobacterium antibioticum TaxID=2728847 RepID=A0A7Y0ANT4_9FLAO|nr:GLPGLI family protein [Chryseobacterium antibioticum]NML70758.1 GLPGLI family protein [Chryseobacterium antibioticum]
MKKIFLINFILLSIFCFSQKGFVRYGYFHALSIGNAKAPESESYLVFNKQSSYYVTAKESLEKAADRSEQKTFTNEEGGGAIYNGTKMSEEGDQVVNHLAKKTMWSNLLYKKQVYVKEITPTINWKIGKETKKIGKFTCKIATANFRGRNYTAWFTSAIPLPYGPWKLQGLPGLILEAYDTGKFVYWNAKNIEYPSNTKEETKYLDIPVKEKFLTYTEFKKFQKDQLDRLIEKNRIAKQSYPEIQLEGVKISDMFVECE